MMGLTATAPPRQSWLEWPLARRLVLAAWGAVLTAFLWLNLHVSPGGIVSNAILVADNPYLQAQQAVAQLPALRRGDNAGLVLALPDGLTPAAIAQIRRISTDLQALLPTATVLSLSHNLNRYQTDGESLSSSPYLPAAGELPDLALLRQQLADNPLASQVLLGRRGADAKSGTGQTTEAGDDYRYAQILLLLPEDFSEQQLVDVLAEYLEQRSIHPLEWLLWKADIRPVAAFANVSLSGWAVGRGLMHYALISDVLWYCTLGLVLATGAAWLALGSWRQALLSSLVIAASFVLTRGSLPLLEWLGVTIGSATSSEPLRERVYFLLVLSSLIVAGISLNTRALEAFNARWQQRDLACWRALVPAHAAAPGNATAGAPAQQVALGWRVLPSLLPRFNLVLGIAALNFLGLSQIGIRGVLELGLLSALGLVYLRLLVATLLPCLHIAWQALPAATAPQQWLQKGMRRLTSASVRYWLRRSPRQALLRVWLGMAALLLAVSAVVMHDLAVHNLAVRGESDAQPLIQVREKPIDYLPDTIIDRSRSLLNTGAGSGFAQLSFWISPRQVANPAYPPVADRDFVLAVAALQQRLQQLAGSRSVLSVVDQLALMQPLAAQSTAAFHDHLQLLRWDLQDERLADFWWTSQGLVLWLGHAADDSVSLRQYSDAVLALAAREFPQLQLQPFGALHSYHQTDLYISERKPLNTLLGLPLVLLLCAGWFGWQNQRLAQKQTKALVRLQPLAAAAAVCLPFVLAYGVVVLLMALCAIPLDQATACATALGINAAIDFDLYLLEDFREALADGQTPEQALQHSIGERGPVTLLDAGLNGIVFSFLLASSFIPMQRLGALMLVLLAVCAAGALWLLPAVLRSCCRPALQEKQR